MCAEGEEGRGEGEERRGGGGEEEGGREGGGDACVHSPCIEREWSGIWVVISSQRRTVHSSYLIPRTSQ